MGEEYLLLYHKEDLLEILNHNDACKHFPLYINFIQLHDQNPKLAVDLLNNPETNLEELDKAAIRTQLIILKEVDKKFELKSNVHCRVLITHLGRRGSLFPSNKDDGKFIRISGTVMRITATKLLEYQRSYVCVKCKYPTMVRADYNRKYMIKQPTQCKNPEGCSGSNLVHFGDLDSDNCKDYQEIKIQEQVKKLGMGSVPNTIWVTLEDDLVDSCQPGDDVTICGIVKKRFGEFCPGKRIDIDLVFKANHLQVDTDNSSFPLSNPESENIFKSFWEQYKQNPLEGRDLILKSFCPEIYGLFPVKLAIATVLAGGCAVEDKTSTGVRTRSESHLLIVGDPGTGKSQLLRFASKIVPRAVLTTGVGSTAAGLTVTAMKEHGEWQLEAGALVMADGGICCIDEFNSMKEHDRTTIHEAMEQQTISVAKASMVCKLNTRCSIIAACNPKGNIDPTQTMSMNIALPSPLLSRFDLVMMLRDTVNQEWDEVVIDHILNLNGGTNLSKLNDFGFWPVKNLQAYFKRIKKFQPKITDDAELILRAYFNLQRKMVNRNKARTTVRLLESLVRLSQGHARLMYHEKVEVIDSIYAVYLVDISMDVESSVMNLNTCINRVFPEKPDIVYKNMIKSVLNRLQLHELLEKELHVLNLIKDKEIRSCFFANQRESSDESKNILENDEDLNSVATMSPSDFHNKPGPSKIINNSQLLVETMDEEIIKKNKMTEEIIKEKPLECNKKQFEKVCEMEKTPLKNKKSSLFESGFDELIFEDDNLKDTPKLARGSAKNDLRDISTRECSKSKKLSNKSIKSANSIDNDLEVLKLMPGVNDDFNIDLNTDWDHSGTTMSESNPIDSKKVTLESKENNIFESVDVDFDFDI